QHQLDQVLSALMVPPPLCFQGHGASLQQPGLRRMKRMTPFWRGVSLRPVGASCRDNSECITMLCRKNRCFLRTASE
ncbi:LEAP2 protein, partial [Brachypteracias leptosomus]|nr:LEAP2 protein [Brachypteracias leptosomus]